MGAVTSLLRKSAGRLVLVALAGFAAPAAQAETLMEALAHAYALSPALQQERARVRATDEQLAQAQSGYRPRIFANAEYGVSTQNTSDRAFTREDGVTEPSPGQVLQNRRNIQRNDGFNHPYGYNIQLQQPIFDGFSTVGAVRQAQSNIMAAREQLRAVEQRVLLEAVRSYANVLRDKAIATLRENNLRILTRELEATKERFRAGDKTRTEVAQAKSRRASAAANLDVARANLRAALAEYERAVGRPADGLSRPGQLEIQLPSSLEEAIEIGIAESPQVVEAAFREQATVHEITRIRGELLPQLTLTAQHQERFDINRSIDNQQVQSVTARLSMPLYSGGEVEARIRAAKQERQGRLEGIEEARQQIRAQTIAAWSQLVANRSQVSALEVQVSAANEALAGVREEQQAGQRTLLDLLDAEQERLEAQIGLERARRDALVASYSVLNAIGRLTATYLGLGTELYDVEDNYQQTNGRAWGVRIQHYDDDSEGLRGLANTVSPGWDARITP